MIRTLSIATTIALVAGLTSTASAITTIDFELNAPAGFASQVPLTNEYAAQGVNFVGFGEVLNMSSFTFKWRSGTDALAYNDVTSSVGPQNILFDQDTSFVTLFGAVFEAGSITMEAFDAGNASLGSASITPGGTYTELTLSGVGDIRSVVVDSDASIWAVDDLSFEPSGDQAAVIPEPVTGLLGLIALGTVGLAATRRRAG